MSKKELENALENEHCCCCEGHECDCEDVVCCCEDCTCACHDELFNYKGTTYTVNFDETYCDEIEECECCKVDAKKVALIGAGVAAAGGVLFYALNKKKKK